MLIFFLLLLIDSAKCDTDTCVGLSSGTAGVYSATDVKDASGNSSQQTNSISFFELQCSL